MLTELLDKTGHPKSAAPRVPCTLPAGCNPLEPLGTPVCLGLAVWIQHLYPSEALEDPLTPQAPIPRRRVGNL